MLGKLKVLLKIVAAFIVLAVILFGIYRREYLSQAIPVYMQYLEQRDKWEHLNTGTYAYYSPLLNTYYFIKNNTIDRIMLYGNPYEPRFVKKFEDSHFYKIAKESKRVGCYFKNKEYLIEKRFDAISRLILIEELTGGYASYTKCNFRFTIKYFYRRIDSSYRIGYNALYGYPIELYNSKSKYLPSEPIFVRHLVMLPEGTEYTKKVLNRVLSYFIKQERLKNNHTPPKFKLIDIVGGNLIKSAIFKSYKVPMVIDKNVSK